MSNKQRKTNKQLSLNFDNTDQSQKLTISLEESLISSATVLSFPKPVNRKNSFRDRVLTI